MAFVSDKYGFVFVHITKTGGTSIKSALATMHGASLEEQRDGYRHSGVGNNVPAEFRPNAIQVHDPLHVIRERWPAAKKYHSFCVVRNPWARIYSLYRHKLRRADDDLPRDNGGAILPFHDCMRVNPSALMIPPQTWWMGGDTLVIRFEMLAEGFRGICERLDLPRVDLPQLNRDPRQEGYAQHYNAHARRLVGHYYRWEIERYGYKF